MQPRRGKPIPGQLRPFLRVFLRCYSVCSRYEILPLPQSVLWIRPSLFTKATFLNSLLELTSLPGQFHSLRGRTGSEVNHETLSITTLSTEKDCLLSLLLLLLFQSSETKEDIVSSTSLHIFKIRCVNSAPYIITRILKCLLVRLLHSAVRV